MSRAAVVTKTEQTPTWSTVSPTTNMAFKTMQKRSNCILFTFELWGSNLLRAPKLRSTTVAGFTLRALVLVGWPSRVLPWVWSLWPSSSSCRVGCLLAPVPGSLGPWSRRSVVALPCAVVVVLLHRSVCGAKVRITSGP